MSSATLLISCPDRPGLVATFARFVSEAGGNIIDSDHHTDQEAGIFLSRIEWEQKGFKFGPSELPDRVAEMTQGLDAQWTLHFNSKPRRVALFVSQQDHCLVELLWRHEAGEYDAEFPIVISNHPSLEHQCKKFGIDFAHVPVNSKNKVEAEKKHLDILKEHQVDTVVLAKYMQIISPEFLLSYPQTINIHHSFLPSFAGAKPYHRAFDRGVKLIGATAHYVTKDLDEGPIIEQDVERVSHRHRVEDLIRLGKDIEKIVLARALRLHLENRIHVYNNKTVIFA